MIGKKQMQQTNILSRGGEIGESPAEESWAPGNASTHQ